MGETGVSDNSDPANIYFNPANVVGPRGAYLNGSRWDFPLFSDDIWIGRGSGGLRFGSGDAISFGGDVTYGRLDYGESIATDASGNPLATVHNFEDFIALTIGVGLHFGNNWEARVGASGKRYHGHFAIAEVSPPTEFRVAEPDAFAMDIGTTLARRYDMGEWNVVPAIAVAYVNFGSDIDFGTPEDDPLPTRFHFGTSLRAESPTARVLGADVPVIAVVYNLEAVDRMHDSYFSWGIGGEIAIAQMLFVRAGTSDIDDDDDDSEDLGEFESQSGWGVGAGIPVGPVRTRFDYTKISDSYTDKKLGLSIDWLF